MDLQRNSIASIFYTLKRKAKASYCLSTFYSAWHKLGLSLFNRFKKVERKLGIRAKQSLSIIHIDVTKHRLEDNTLAYIYVVKDNFSRLILEIKAFKELKALHTQEVINIVVEKYFGADTSFKQVMTDGGPENNGLKGYIKKYAIHNLHHIVAQVDVNFSNSMVEAANMAIKYYGLHLEKITNFEHLEKLLPALKTKMNATMMTVLTGLTPQEVFDGKTIEDIYGTIQQSITRIDRLKKNKQINCCKFFDEL